MPDQCCLVNRSFFDFACGSKHLRVSPFLDHHARVLCGCVQPKPIAHEICTTLNAPQPLFHIADARDLILPMLRGVICRR